MNKNQIPLGFSDIRLWFAYFISLSLAFFAGIWVGMFWAVILVAVPAFALSIRLLGVLDQDATVHKKWQVPVRDAVYESIKKDDQNLEKENALLRKNTKIIQDQEKELKRSNKQKIKGQVKIA